MGTVRAVSLRDVGSVVVGVAVGVGVSRVLPGGVVPFPAPEPAPGPAVRFATVAPGQRIVPIALPEWGLFVVEDDGQVWLRAGEAPVVPSVLTPGGDLLGCGE